MKTKRTERLAVCPREIVTYDDRHVQHLGHRFDPADQVDGGPNHGEIKPFGGADIAVDCLADVKRYDDLKRLADD